MILLVADFDDQHWSHIPPGIDMTFMLGKDLWNQIYIVEAPPGKVEPVFFMDCLSLTSWFTHRLEPQPIWDEVPQALLIWLMVHIDEWDAHWSYTNAIKQQCFARKR